MAIGLIIRTNGTVERKEVSGLQNIYKAINCNCIEGIGIENGIVYLDEEGKLKPEPVVNRKASLLAWSQNRLRIDDCIVGDVIVFGTRSSDGDCDGEDYDYPEYLNELLK